MYLIELIKKLKIPELKKMLNPVNKTHTYI